MFQILWSLIAGLVIGGLARLLLPGKQAIPVWLTVLLGIAGAFLGNGIASWIGVRHTGGVDWIRHILQIGIAMALIAALAPVWANRAKSHTRA
ncbi:MAG TPA: GlsB/YeaQ/YmgE family stress response membrane protein [Actinocrinis sp.]|uniref:GlsB/YeaQ/YmgE family stress response membrane protein n=1 Tax=Actinocrinis sp. TaxID=1920516 RepID=UPI002D405501|nr:GlsB/YeaQ/YmgE family stress response membrane protein [Actinocrinis sp.]HZU58558.1 GlsB/YeaQ/YmgE family stress response membrane protein [Actinocrinis sp.]